MLVAPFILELALQKMMKLGLRTLSIVIAAGVFLEMQHVEAQTDDASTTGVVKPLGTVDVFALPAPPVRKDIKVIPRPLPQFPVQKPLPSTPADESVPHADQSDSSEPAHPDGE